MPMRPLVVTSAMTSMNGTFYPTGHVFALFKDEAAARQAMDALQTANHQGQVAHADPARIFSQITHSAEGEEEVLPSPGADNDIVRRIKDLADRGYHGVLMELGDSDNIETLQSVVDSCHAEAAFYYRTLIIEELVEQPKNLESRSVSGTHAPGAHPTTSASENLPPTEIRREDGTQQR